MSRFACLLVSLSLCGCSTLNSAGNVSRDSPKFFIGTQLNVAAISDDDAKLRRFRRFSMVPAPYPVPDLPLSFALDAFLVPHAMMCAIELFGSQFGCYSPP